MRADERADPPDGLAERVWWTRVERAAERKGLIGAPGLMADWCHAWLGARNKHAGDEALIAAEQARLNDDLGKRLGVGPMPG